MTDTDGDPYLERGLILQDQDTEAGYPRDLRQNLTQIAKNKSMGRFLMKFCFTHILVPGSIVCREDSFSN